MGEVYARYVLPCFTVLNLQNARGGILHMPPRLKNWLIGMSKFKHPELHIYSWVQRHVWVVRCRNNKKQNKKTVADEVKDVFVG